jgi:hypothetical protein
MIGRRVAQASRMWKTAGIRSACNDAAGYKQ